MSKRSPKLSPHELAEILHEVLEQERAQRIKKQQTISRILYKLRRAITVPIIIGIIAAVLMYLWYGREILIQTLLSWTIGLTILAAAITLLERWNKISALK